MPDLFQSIGLCPALGVHNPLLKLSCWPITHEQLQYSCQAYLWKKVLLKKQQQHFLLLLQASRPAIRLGVNIAVAHDRTSHHVAGDSKRKHVHTLLNNKLDAVGKAQAWRLNKGFEARLSDGNFGEGEGLL